MSPDAVFEFSGSSIALGGVISVAVSVLAILFAVKCKYRTARWRGAGARCFWFSLLFIIPTVGFELLGEKLLFEVNAFAWDTFDETKARFTCAIGRMLYYFIFVGGAEEAGKILAVYIGTGGYHRMKSPNEIINYALISAAAFTGLENILYFIMTRGNVANAIIRAAIASPFHITCTMLIALGALRSMQEGKQDAKIMGIMSAILIHGCYDFVADYVMQSKLAALAGSFLVFMVVAMIFVVINILKAPRRYAEQNATATCKLCGAIMPGLPRRCGACNATVFTYKVEYPPMTFPKNEPPLLLYEQTEAYGKNQAYAQGWTAVPQSFAAPQTPTAQVPASAQMPNAPQTPPAPYVQPPVTEQQPMQMPEQSPQ